MTISLSNGFTVYLDINGASVGTIDNIVQTINSGSTVESIAGMSQVVAAVTGPIPGLGLLTNTVALTLAGVTSDPNGATVGQVISATGNVIAMVAGAFAIAGVAAPALSVGAVVLTVAGAAYNFYDMYNKYAPSSIDPTTTIKSLFQQAEATRSPLVLDLDGDGVETLGLSSDIHFDHDGNGFAELTGWAGKDDGLLVLDKNGNGTIDNGGELFGNNTTLSSGTKAAHGFAALGELDTNADGKVNANDAAFADLRVWRDANSDGVAQTGELLTLAAAGVQSLGLSNTAATTVDTNGNAHKQIGTYTGLDGSSRAMDDVWFTQDTARTVDQNIVAISSTIAALPEIAGFGNVHSLHQAMETMKRLRRRFTLSVDTITSRPLQAEVFGVALFNGTYELNAANGFFWKRFA